jgi:hypothetical protein
MLQTSVKYKKSMKCPYAHEERTHEGYARKVYGEYCACEMSITPPVRCPADSSGPHYL